MTFAESALFQPIDRDYRLHGIKRVEHLEMKRDGIAHALRAQIRNFVVVHEVGIERYCEHQTSD